LAVGFASLVLRHVVSGAALVAASLALALFAGLLAYAVVLMYHRQLRRRTLFFIADTGHRVLRLVVPRWTPGRVRLWRFQHNLNQGLEFLLARKDRMLAPAVWILLDWVLTIAILWAAFRAVNYPIAPGLLIIGFGVRIVVSLVSLVPTGVVALLDGLGAVALLTRDAVHAALRRPPEWRTIAEQLEQIGWRSLSIVNLTAFFTGMVLALQLGTYMARFGAKMFVSRIVGMALVRELGPVLTALMIGGRVGAGITAELGTMAVTDQIDAIRALGASPIRNLVVPRLIAVLVMLPVLTIIGDLVGILGGLLLSVTELNVSGEFY